MRILIDVDALERQGVLTPELARVLRASALRDTSSFAINMVLAFGATAVAAGLLVLFQSAIAGDVFGVAFLAGGYAVTIVSARSWGQLGRVWMVVGALMLSGSIAIGLNDRPLVGSLAATAILSVVALLARSRFLMALAPLGLAASIGASTGYWHAGYEIAIREPTLTIVLFTSLGIVAWLAAKRAAPDFSDIAVTFARVCVILVNFGFWIGSLWGDTPGRLWTGGHGVDLAPSIPAMFFVIAWAMGLVAAAAWGAANGRKFLVNSVATFGSIHFYTQWFERLGLEPVSVIGGGLAAMAIGLAFWRYNARAH